MATQRDLQIVYSLHWKNPAEKKCLKDMAVVVVYDIPATTMHFERFKNYLLKNCGIDGYDVVMSYVMENGKENTIQSQIDFQIALYAFRRKARAGQMINLLLERTDDFQTHRNIRQSSDVETQSDEAATATAAPSSVEAPAWFTAGLNKLKAEILDNVNEIVTAAVADLKTPSTRCAKKQIDSKDLLKSLKLENKLEKLERKATKYREKRIALHIGPVDGDIEKLDASPLDKQQSIPHLEGGQTYVHKWQIKNTGKIPWNALSTLEYTWGSKQLIPINKVVKLPELLPDEQGVVEVTLKIPQEAGKYECYWQFMQSGHRFGRWLGVQVVVDSTTTKVSATDEVSSDESWASEPVDWNKILVPSCFTCEEENNNVKDDRHNNSIKLTDEELDNIVLISLPKDDEVKDGFVYVNVDGQKVMVPKDILKPEVVVAAAAATTTSVSDDNTSPTPSKASTVPDNIQMDRSSYFEANNFVSHCSAQASCFSEVNEYPVDFIDDCLEPVPNYQQTPPNERRSPLMNEPVDLSAPVIAASQGISQAFSSAMDSAKSAFKRIIPSPPVVATEAPMWTQSEVQNLREANLQALIEMGFYQLELNSTLLDRFHDDLSRTITELVK